MQSLRLQFLPLAAIGLGVALGSATLALTASFASAATSTPPILSGIAVTNIGSTSAVVGWDTDQPADSQVFYGTSTEYGSTSGLDATATTTHAVMLSSLAAGTAYHFYVQSTNASGTATSTDQMFTTESATTSPVTILSNITVSSIASTSATISWTTDQAASSQVMYGTTASYGSSSALDSTATTSHSVLLSALAAGTTYHFQVQSDNANGLATSSDQTFATASSTATSTPLALLGIDTTRGTATPDSSFADGWEWLFHFSVPNAETQFALKLSDFVNATSTILAANNIRYFSPESSNATSVNTAITITAANTYPTTMLDFTGVASTSTTGNYTADVTVQMMVPVGTAPGSYTSFWGAESTTTASTTP